MTLDWLMGIAGFLLIVSIFANRISDRFGIPGLLLFLGIGMLAGTDGVGKIQFSNARLSNYIGTVALTFILFSGGLETKWNEVKPVVVRGSVLSTAGVFLTAFFLFVCAYYLIGLSFEVALLLSVIVSSTDAPAVFAIMRTSGMHLKTGLKPILEFESGSNDPMAVLLSMGAITILTADSYSATAMLSDFVLQMAIGLGLGLAVGFGVGRFLQKWCLVYQGLYPVFGVGVVLVTFSLTQLLHGNGFLAVYLCGIVLGNTPFMYRRHLIRFQDSLAWIMQIGMFLILGLLVNPHEFNGIMLVSFACSLALMFVARPAAVFICLFKSGYTLNEKLFISWAGLKGAVPIILATYPLMERFPNSQFLFNLIFFLVIISVLFQGKTLAPLARRLKLEDRN